MVEVVRKNVGKCRYCGRRVQYIGGRWHHVWWGRQPDGTSILCGSPTCLWRGYPPELSVSAEIQSASPEVG